MRSIGKILKNFNSNDNDSRRIKLGERKLKELVVAMLNDRRVTEKTSPKTDEYILMDEDLQMSLCIEKSNIKVANHEYTINVPTTLKFCEGLKKLVKDKVESDHRAMKKRIFKNQIDLIDKLVNIYKQE